MYTVGVSLVVQGLPAPNNSLVDLDDVLDTYFLYEYDLYKDVPTNSDNHYKALLCVTDHKNCCQTPRLGSWYFPDGSTVQNVNSDQFWRTSVRSNRGQNELRNAHQFYGSVRLFRRRSSSIRGRFRCEIPDANNVTQTLYANIGENNSITV